MQEIPVQFLGQEDPLETLGIGCPLQYSWASSAGEESACNVGDLGSIPGLENLLEKGTATHSSILAWRIPWTV